MIYFSKLFLVAMRIIGAFAFLPIFRGHYMTTRVKVTLVFLLSLLLLPNLQEKIPATNNLGIWAKYALIELFIGAGFGFVIHIYYATLHMLGSIISMQSGLSAATMYDPSQKEQIAIFTNLFLFMGMACFFVSDMHHAIILGLVNTYDYWRCGAYPDMTTPIVEALSQSLTLSFQIASPFLIVEAAILLGSGILAKLMPTLQVFFVITPVQIFVTFCIVFVVINQIIEIVLEHILKLLL